MHASNQSGDRPRARFYHRTGGDPETANALAQLIADNPIDPQL